MGENPELHRVYAELWTSFVALIRSYVAAHDLAVPAAEHARVIEGEGGNTLVCTRQKMVILNFDEANGAGSWTVYDDKPGVKRFLEQGRFEIDEDSRVVLSDRAGKLELEVAAEAFTAKVFDGE